MSTKLPATALSVLASTAVIGGLFSAPPALAAPQYLNQDPIIPGQILISEVSNGSAGTDSNANRVSANNFIEIGNFGSDPVDVGGLRIMRCGQTGDVYGPQQVIPDGTVLAPGQKYTVAGPTSTDAHDARYDATGSSLHEFGFGALLETKDSQILDRVGFYHSSVLSECGMDDRAVERPLDHRLNQSHQRIATTGDAAKDWAIGTRTPAAANITADAPTPRRDMRVLITEVANEGSASTSDQFIELTNFSDAPVDVDGWKLYRCGENGTTYIQNSALTGSIPAGGSYVIAHANGAQAASAQATFASGMHWRDYGAMLVQPDDSIVDSFGSFANRNSMCTDGEPMAQDVNSLQNESYHRVSDTGNNAKDFVVATQRTPGVATDRKDLSIVEPGAGFSHGPIRFSEFSTAGPGGTNDEVVELANFGDQPVNLKGYSLTRCEGTGRGNVAPQIADLGDITLAPGETYLATDNNAPASLLEAADGVYTTGLADDTAGMYLRAPDGTMVDAVGIYETVTYSPCVIGSEIRGWAKEDTGESHQRARTTGDNEEDFVVSERSPGALKDVKYVDPTKPLPGELDPVKVETNAAPGTPQAVAKVRKGVYGAQVKVSDADGGDLDVTVRAASPAAGVDTASAKVWGGATSRKVPSKLRVTGERRVTSATLSAKADGQAYPFLRFAVPASGVPAEGVEFTFSAETRERNDVQMYAWDGSAWALLTHAAADADDNVTLVGALKPEHLVDGDLNVLVIDGPRVSGGLVDEVGVTDQSFADPSSYDWSMNHMSDTQFLSEGFRDVFRKQASWVVANAEGRKIGYSTNTGDVIENWMNGNADPKRADKEFAAAKKIQQLLNDADIPNGVLPGNHDNHWGRENTRFNQYFGPEMYEDKSWYGAEWKKGDNSAHYDFVTEAGVEYLMLSLPYRPTNAQIDWAREVADSHPSHNVVLLTHSYLDTNKKIEDLDNRTTARGHVLWRDLIAPSDNIFLVLGGHYHGVSTKYGDPVTGEQIDAISIAEDTVAVRNVGETGRSVVQMLADYQGYRSTQPTPRTDVLDRDSGFQRLLQFDTDAELMGVNAYSPHVDSFEAYKYDEPGARGTAAADWKDGRYQAKDDEFVAQVDLLVAKRLTAADWGVTAAATTVAEKKVAAGSTTVLDLTPAPGTRWYVVATDTAGASARSVPVTVSLDEAPVPAATVELSSTRTSQQIGAAADQDRALLRAEVTGDPSEGDLAGTVEFVATSGPSAGTVLGTAPLTLRRDAGVAELRLAANLAVGAHGVEARFVPADDAVIAAAASAAVTVTVTAAAVVTPPKPTETKPVTPKPVKKVKAKTTSKLTKKTVRSGQRASLKVSVKASKRANGTVKVVLKSKGKVRTVTAKVVNGKVTLKLPRLSKGTWTVASTYRGSSTVSADKAPTVKLRVR